MESIIQKNKDTCYLCGRWESSVNHLDCHHIFGGANRNNSTKYGLMVYLCHNECHIFGAHAVHNDKRVDEKLKQIGQRAFEDTHGDRDKFMGIFGRNWL